MANEFGPRLERLGVLRDLGEPPRIMNPTLRDKAISASAPVMQWWQSLSPANKELTESQAKAQALKSTKRIFGDVEAENIMDSLGILDFSPAGLIFAGDEAYREFGKAEKPTDYILPTIGLGLSAVEAYPLTKPLVSAATKPLRRFLSNLSSKTSATTDMSRRNILKGAVAAPVVAGALSNIPLGKVVDEIVPAVDKAAPVLKKAKNIKSMLRLTDLPQMKKSLLKSEPDSFDPEWYSKEFGREIKSFDDLSPEEIDLVYSDHFEAPGADSGIENNIREEISEILEDFQLSPKSFVEGKEKLTAEQIENFPIGEILEDFTAEMKKSGYSNKEISDVIDNALGDLFDQATSLDEMM